MSSTKKTIKINPELFKLTPSKNTGNRAKTSKNRGGTTQPIFKPNKIKKKLLERIKEHSRAKTGGHDNVTSDAHVEEGANKYAEEFYESMNYLSNLANETNASSPYKQSSKQTRKRPPSISSDNVHVNIELPDDLKEHTIGQVGSDATITLNNASYGSINPPYGCLKGGQKPTYRAWNKSQRSYESIVTPIVSMPSSSTPDTTHATTNENRLAKLKEVFKQKRHVLQKPQSVDLPAHSIISLPLSINTQETSYSYPVFSDDTASTSDGPALLSTPQPLIKVDDSDTKFAINPSIPPISDADNATMILTPKKTKKTTTRKYRIGKDTKRRVVGVLIKDRQTRKKILDAQRSIRRTPIPEMKKYLHMHGLMKSGSHAPNDIIRKMYESSVMSGDVFNNDNEILAHNFSQDL